MADFLMPEAIMVIIQYFDYLLSLTFVYVSCRTKEYILARMVTQIHVYSR